ncbi:MAG TPA: YceD family protein [Accumulibacter sp.]|nr:YceD family protein [Accumulibacter sp.]HPP46707.1 YceD family protein [Accumulibacter sp.]
MHIDSLSFGREGGSLTGELQIAALARTQDLLTDASGCLRYRAKGALSERGRVQLHLEVTGTLALCCQRCLETLEYPLQLHSLLEFIDSENDLTQEELEDDSRDFLTNDKALDVENLIEDEILLALPPAPRHENCRLPLSGRETATVSPFSVLAGLRGKA